jgi:bacterioferritin
MSGITVNAEVVSHLNIILKNELTAINQYFLHSRMLKNQGIHKLAEKEYEESIDEMKHADKLIYRILFIGGLPNLQDLGKLMIGENPEEMLRSDLKMEYANHKDLMKAHKVCQDTGDVGSEMLLEDIIKSEEEHIDWLNQQIRLIDTLGVENYLQTQVHDGE